MKKSWSSNGSTGYSWPKMFAVQAGAYRLENGHTNFIGFGSQAFANPDFSKEILSESKIVSGKIGITCTKCLELRYSKLPTSFAVRDKAYSQRYQ